MGPLKNNGESRFIIYMKIMCERSKTVDKNNQDLTGIYQNFLHKAFLQSFYFKKIEVLGIIFRDGLVYYFKCMEFLN